MKTLEDVKNKLPRLNQRQDSVSDQLSDMHHIANILGMYDAADAIKQIHGSMDNLKYGCHCDMEDDGPSECVIDDPNYSINDCTFAKNGMRKEQCEYWKIIK